MLYNSCFSSWSLLNLAVVLSLVASQFVSFLFWLSQCSFKESILKLANHNDKQVKAHVVAYNFFNYL